MDGNSSCFLSDPNLSPLDIFTKFNNELHHGEAYSHIHFDAKKETGMSLSHTQEIKVLQYQLG